MTKTFDVLIGDGNADLLEQWAILVDGTQGLRVVGKATDGQQVRNLCSKLLPHVVVLDAEIPFGNGFTLGLLIRRQFPDIRLILLSKGRLQDKQDALAIGVCRQRKWDTRAILRRETLPQYNQVSG